MLYVFPIVSKICDQAETNNEYQITFITVKFRGIDCSDTDFIILLLYTNTMAYK